MKYCVRSFNMKFLIFSVWVSLYIDLNGKINEFWQIEKLFSLLKQLQIFRHSDILMYTIVDFY